MDGGIPKSTQTPDSGEGLSCRAILSLLKDLPFICLDFCLWVLVVFVLLLLLLFFNGAGSSLFPFLKIFYLKSFDISDIRLILQSAFFFGGGGVFCLLFGGGGGGGGPVNCQHVADFLIYFLTHLKNHAIESSTVVNRGGHTRAETVRQQIPGRKLEVRFTVHASHHLMVESQVVGNEGS